ncbi:MAG: IS982 family transposase [Bacteroidetes bacterium]|nr:IS982 family transposase [Bacteroidota bacterium]
MRFDITALYCCLDDFAKVYEDWEHHQLIDTGRKRRRQGMLSLSEMLLIMVLFHADSFKNFKYFYIYGISHKYRDCFSEIPSYERFIALQSRLFAPLSVLLHMLTAQSEKTGLYVVDSSCLKVCHNKRIARHKVFEGMATRGKSTMGWFFSFKLHVVINHKGEIVAVHITPGNVDDRAPLARLTAGLKGVLLADKGYISKKWFKELWEKGLHILVGIRRNMKNYLMPLFDKLLLRKRFIIETAFGILKQNMGLEHSRHRSPINALCHILSCLVAYCFRGKKPKKNFADNKNAIAYP